MLAIHFLFVFLVGFIFLSPRWRKTLVQLRPPVRAPHAGWGEGAPHRFWSFSPPPVFRQTTPPALRMKGGVSLPELEPRRTIHRSKIELIRNARFTALGLDGRILLHALVATYARAGEGRSQSQFRWVIIIVTLWPKRHTCPFGPSEPTELTEFFI